jgi:hypothetical protein
LAGELQRVFADNRSALTNILETVTRGDLAAVKIHDPHGATEYVAECLQRRVHGVPLREKLQPALRTPTNYNLRGLLGIGS